MLKTKACKCTAPHQAFSHQLKLPQWSVSQGSDRETPPDTKDIFEELDMVHQFFPMATWGTAARIKNPKEHFPLRPLFKNNGRWPEMQFVANLSIVDFYIRLFKSFKNNCLFLLILSSFCLAASWRVSKGVLQDLGELDHWTWWDVTMLYMLVGQCNAEVKNISIEKNEPPFWSPSDSLEFRTVFSSLLHSSSTSTPPAQMIKSRGKEEGGRKGVAGQDRSERGSQ